MSAGTVLCCMVWLVGVMFTNSVQKKHDDKMKSDVIDKKVTSTVVIDGKVIKTEKTYLRTVEDVE